MSQEIEIEFKTLLAKSKFELIKEKLLFPADPVIQTNYYFETANFDFKQQHSALRIREKNNRYTLTLKQPHPKGILETHDTLSRSEWKLWIEGSPVTKEHTGKQIAEMNIPIDAIDYFGLLKTERYTFEENHIMYVLDKSFYNHCVDYELEIESTDYTSGEIAFTNILDQFALPKQMPITKIERFFKTSKKQQ